MFHIRKPRRINLMLRDQVSLAGPGPQVIAGNGVSEVQRGGGVLLAEDDHVGEVLVFFGGGVFAVDAAGWEDGLDGADG